MGLPTAELQSLTNKSIIELYTLTLVSALHGSTDVTRFHSGVGLNSNASIEIASPESINTSFPEFIELGKKLGCNFEIS